MNAQVVVEGRREEADDDTKRVPAGVRERLWGRRNVSGAPMVSPVNPY